MEFCIPNRLIMGSPEEGRKIEWCGHTNHGWERVVVTRSIGSSLRQRTGMGLPVGKHIVPDKPYEALGWLCGGLGFFATLGLLAVFNDKASKVPWRDVVLA